MTGVDRYTDAIAEIRSLTPRTEAESIALAQVHATLAQAAATALQAMLPLVGGDHVEVTAWAKLLLPGFSAENRYTEAEWRGFMSEEAPSLPLEIAGLNLTHDEAASGPIIDVDVPPLGTGLDPKQAAELGAALLAWAHRHGASP